MINQRGSFKSNFGVIMAVSGSAVGLGNIWRFPYVAGENGGAAFIVLYVAIILLIGLPMVLSEFSIGRASKRSPIKSFEVLKPKTKWYIVGYISVISGLTILGFYSVISGWTIKFCIDAFTGGFNTTDVDVVKQNFDAFVNSGWQPVLYSILFIVMTIVIVLRGVEKGVEKFNKIMMPILLFILFLLAGYSMTLDGFQQSLDFLFTPDFSKITPQTVLDAMGQVFFSLSIGMGVIITYSSYVTKSNNMLKSNVIVVLIDTLIAIVAGLVIFPAVFTYGLSPEEGPSLVFITLPTVFAQMPGGIIVGGLFFVLLFIAAITSSISIFEMVTAVLVEHYNISRKKALAIIGSAVSVLAILSAVSQMETSSMKLFGYNIFDALDILSANYLLPLGGLSLIIFVGWVFDKKLLKDTFTSDGEHSKFAFKPFRFIIRYVAPVVIAIVFLSKLGFI